ncbi:hypothetical protein HNY73_009565 [Argiope bruennichi]|uniref:Uncharacterized protein n=1 Tax=Argiope bruennichi TaxID=94029 RepID=A0A8T0F9W4_ARGBR|nr:hypothetical protein HNY73_009565 [Argiope bruennichi]
MDYLSKASILLCCCFLLFADGQYIAKRFGRKGNEDPNNNGLLDNQRKVYSLKTNQYVISSTKEKSTESAIDGVNDLQHQHSFRNDITTPRRQGRRAVSFGSRLSGSTSTNSSVTTIRPNVNSVKSQIRSSTMKPASVGISKSKENGSRAKTFNKLGNPADETQVKGSLNASSGFIKNEKGIIVSTEESSSQSSSYESGKAIYGTGRRFTTRRSFIRQSKPGFASSITTTIPFPSEPEILTTSTTEKISGNIHLQEEVFPSSSKSSYLNSSSPFSHLKTRLGQRRFNKFNSASNSESLSLESEATEILNNEKKEKVSEEIQSSYPSSSLPSRKTIRFTKRPFYKSNSNLHSTLASKSTHESSNESNQQDQNISHVEDSTKYLKQESETSEKLNSMNDERVSEDKTNQFISSSLQRRKTTRLTKRPFNKLNSNLQNMYASKSSHEFSNDYISKDQNLSQLENSSELPSLFLQTESPEKVAELTEKLFTDEEVTGQTKENSKISFSSNRLKGARFTRRPSNRRNYVPTIAAKPTRKSYSVSEEPVTNEKENESVKIVPIRFRQQTQPESLESERNGVYPQNVEDARPATPISNQKKGNRRRQSQKLKSEQQNTTDLITISDVSEDVIKSEQQYSNLQFDPIKPIRVSQKETSEEPTINSHYILRNRPESAGKAFPNKTSQWPQTESLESGRNGILNSENIEDTQPATPFLPNRKRSKKGRPSHELNRNQQFSRIKDRVRTFDISEDATKSQQQYSNLQFDPIKPLQVSHKGTIEISTEDSFRNRPEKFIPIRPSQYSQEESAQFDRNAVVNSKNVENMQSATVLSNRKKGNKGRPLHKLNTDQQNSRITNPEGPFDFSEDVINSEQQYSNLEFDPIKPLQASQKETIENSKEDPFRNRPEKFIPIRPPQYSPEESVQSDRNVVVNSKTIENIQSATVLSNRKKGKKGRPLHKLNTDLQDSRITNPERTFDISEDEINSQQQYSNLEFDPIKPLQAPQKETIVKPIEDSKEVFRNKVETPFISTRQRGNRNTRRPFNQYNYSRQNSIRTKPAQLTSLVSDTQHLSKVEDSLEELPLETPHFVSSKPPKRVTGHIEESFGTRGIIPFHSYRQRGSKNTRRPSHKNRIPTTLRQREITQKHHVSQTIDYEGRVAYPISNLANQFVPFSPPQFSINIPSQSFNERDSPFEQIEMFNSKESKSRRRTSVKYSYKTQNGSHRNPHVTNFEKPGMFLPSRDFTQFIPSQHDHRHLHHVNYPKPESEGYEMHSAPPSRFSYNSQHIGRTAGTLLQSNNSDFQQSYDRAQNMLKRFNETKTTPTLRRTKPSNKYTEITIPQEPISTENSGNIEKDYEPTSEVFHSSVEEHKPFISTDSPTFSENYPTTNEPGNSKDISVDVASGVPTEISPHYQHDFSLERIHPDLKLIPTSSPEGEVSESLSYETIYSLESNVDDHSNSYDLSNFPESTRNLSNFSQLENFDSQLTEGDTSSLATKFLSNSLPTANDLHIATEPSEQQPDVMRGIKKSFQSSVQNFDELIIGNSNGKNKSLIYHPSTKQNSPNQAYTSVSFKYPSFSKDNQKDSLIPPKSLISSPLSTIFDTSSENGQYYHYIMNLGQKPLTSKGIAKTKVYSSGNALYTILHEDEFNSQLSPFGYGPFATKSGNESSDKPMVSEHTEQKLINNLKSTNDSNSNFHSEGNLISNSVSSQKSSNETDKSLSEANSTFNQENKISLIDPLIEVTTQTILTEFLTSNLKSEINTTPSSLEDIFNYESTNQTGPQEPSSTLPFLTNNLETSNINESSTPNSVTEIPTVTAFALDIFGNYSFQNQSSFMKHSEDTETTQTFIDTDNALSFVTVTETPSDIPSTIDYLGHLDQKILQRIYLLAKRNKSVSFGNVSYKLDISKLLNLLNENTAALHLTAESRHETTPTSIFFDGFPETSTSPTVTTENSRIFTPLYSNDNIDDIRKNVEGVNTLPVTSLYIVDEGTDIKSTIPITESTTSLPMIKSSPTNNFQLSDNSPEVKKMNNVISSDLSEVTEPTNINKDISKGQSSHPVLELVIKNSSVDDFISKINRVPVVIRVFNPISQSYHSVLITPDGKIGTEANFMKTDIPGISLSDEYSDDKSNTSNPEIIKDDEKLIPDSGERTSDLEEIINTEVYFDPVLPNESYSDNTPSIISNENEDVFPASVTPSQPERKLISIEELKELLMKSVEQSVNLPSPSTDYDNAESVQDIPIMDGEQRIHEMFPKIAKQSSFPIEMNDISPEDISISISESVVINPDPESDINIETKGKDYIKNKEVSSMKSESQDEEINMPIIQNADDPIKMVLSIMETYKPPKEATMWNDEVSPSGESQHTEFPATNQQSLNKKGTHNEEKPLVEPILTKYSRDSESFDVKEFPLTKHNSDKDDETPFIVPLQMESSGKPKDPNNDKPLHLIPIYFDTDEYETPAESQMVYEFQKTNGDLKRIYPFSKSYNNGLRNPDHSSMMPDKISYMHDHKQIPFIERSSNTNLHHNEEFNYAAKIHPVQDHGTYLQYSHISSLHGKPALISMRNYYPQYVKTSAENNGNPIGFPHSGKSDFLSDILAEGSDNIQMFDKKDMKEVEEKDSKHLNYDYLNQLQESGVSPEILIEEASNNYQQMIDINTDNIPMQQHSLRDNTHHSDKSLSMYTSSRRDDKNDYHTAISGTDRYKNSSEKIGKSYHRTLPQYIVPEITAIDSIGNNKKIGNQISDDATDKKEYSISDIQKLNNKGLPERTTSDAQKSSKTWDDRESTVKHVKAIPYVEPKRETHTITNSEKSTLDQFLLLDEPDATVEKPNKQAEKNNVKTDINRKPEIETPLNDNSDYLYPIFKSDRSKYERSLSD